MVKGEKCMSLCLWRVKRFDLVGESPPVYFEYSMPALISSGNVLFCVLSRLSGTSQLVNIRFQQVSVSYVLLLATQSDHNVGKLIKKQKTTTPDIFYLMMKCYAE